MREGATSGFVDRAARRLARRTSTGRYIPQVDGLRFIAIASVVVFHTRLLLYQASDGGTTGFPPDRDPVGMLIGQGRLGVQVFFVISGFVIGLPFAAARLAGGPPVVLRRYFLRRLTRIEPPYVAVLVGLSLLSVTTAWWVHWNPASRLAAGLIYGHGLLFGARNAIDPVFWTLEIEIQFYVVAPLLAAVFWIRDPMRRRVSIAFAAVTITALQGTLHLGASPRLTDTLLNYLQFFLIGFLVADLYVAHQGERRPTGAAWDVVSLVGWPAFFALGLVGGVATHVILPWLAFALFLAAFRGPRTSRLLGRRWIRTIGGMCYSIYLLHMPILWIVLQHTHPIPSGGFTTGNVVVQTAVLLPIVLLFSALFFLLVEKPCMDPRWPAHLAMRVRRLFRPWVRVPAAADDIVDLTVFEPVESMSDP